MTVHEEEAPAPSRKEHRRVRIGLWSFTGHRLDIFYHRGLLTREEYDMLTAKLHEPEEPLMLRIFIKGADGKPEEIPNGPFPITPEQLREARRLFAEEAANSDFLSGTNAAPMTTARSILKTVAPALSDFDCLSLGWAVTASNYRTEDA